MHQIVGITPTEKKQAVIEKKVLGYNNKNFVATGMSKEEIQANIAAGKTAVSATTYMQYLDKLTHTQNPGYSVGAGRMITGNR